MKCLGHIEWKTIIRSGHTFIMHCSRYMYIEAMSVTLSSPTPSPLPKCRPFPVLTSLTTNGALGGGDGLTSSLFSVSVTLNNHVVYLSLSFEVSFISGIVCRQYHGSFVCRQYHGFGEGLTECSCSWE